MATRLVEKAHLSAKGLIGKVRNVFKKVKEPLKGGQGEEQKISITDCLTSALAIFKLKFPSLLQFERGRLKGAGVCDSLKGAGVCDSRDLGEVFD